METTSQTAFSDLGSGTGKQALQAVKGGLDPNTRNQIGEPLILAAARSGCWPVFEALVIAGADADAATPQGHTAYHYAVAGSVRGNYKYWALRCSRAARKIVQWYSKRDFKEASHQAMAFFALNQLKAFKNTLSKGIDVNCRFPDPARVLLPYGTINTARIIGEDMAARLGLAEMERHLRDLRSQEQKQRIAANHVGLDPTLLMWTHALGRTDFSILLLSYGATPSLQDSLGYTCHDYALLNNKPFI